MLVTNKYHIRSILNSIHYTLVLNCYWTRVRDKMLLKTHLTFPFSTLDRYGTALRKAELEMKGVTELVFTVLT